MNLETDSANVITTDKAVKSDAITDKHNSESIEAEVLLGKKC